MIKRVPFDPGIGQFVQDVNTFVNEIYSQLMNLSSLSKKRNYFRLFSNKIYGGLENNISFYYGCLLWAYYIKNHNAESPKEIEGNIFLNLTDEIEEYDYLVQVNFLDNYFDSYERDTLYYIGKKVIIPDLWKNILELYKEFLELNQGFVHTKTTADLILPEKLEIKTENDKINEGILEAIEKKDLNVLLKIN